MEWIEGEIFCDRCGKMCYMDEAIAIHTAKEGNIIVCSNCIEKEN